MDTQQPTDRDLVERAQKGDRRAFGLLVERYQRRVYAVAFGMLHNRDDAMDVVQDAFVKVHRHIEAFQGNASFYTWLYRIVANLCIDVRRRRSRRPEAELNEAVVHSDVLSTGVDVAPRNPEANPVENLTRRELSAEMNRALDDLSENHRLILLMREVEGLSYEELAEVLKISKGTVMSRLFHARKNMQKALRPYLGLADGAGLDGKQTSADGSAGDEDKQDSPPQDAALRE
ncbi:MAG: sigma-70 family RNA polymerase sigma factor [Pseudomonadota bacterium]